MSDLYHKFIKLLLFQLCGLGSVLGWGQQVNLKIAGDSENGFQVAVYQGTQLLLENTEEFSLHLYNLDLSEHVALPAWKGAAWTGDENRMVLTRASYVSELDLNIAVSVTYQVVNQSVVEKRIELFQSGMPSLLYTIEETARPAVAPAKFVTF